jgi:hypothetical protein
VALLADISPVQMVEELGGSLPGWHDHWVVAGRCQLVLYQRWIAQQITLVIRWS